MFKKIAQFLDNNDFHNPVTDKNGSLLSTKEKIKGRILPGLAQVGLLATTLAFYATTAGGLSSLVSISSFAVALISVVVPEITYRWGYRYATKKLPRFDLNTEAGKQSFCAQYPNHGADFTNNYLTLTKELEFEKAPEIFIDKQYRGASAHISSLLPEKKRFVRIGGPLLKDTDTASKNGLLAICAHELGHLMKKDYENSFLFNTAKGINIFLGLSMVLNAGTLFCAEMAYCVANGWANDIADKKRRQYKEREADRISLMATGFAEEYNHFYKQFITEGNLKAYEPKKLSDHFTRARWGLTAPHPIVASRIVYADTFAHKNPEYCEKARAKYSHSK